VSFSEEVERQADEAEIAHDRLFGNEEESPDGSFGDRRLLFRIAPNYVPTLSYVLVPHSSLRHFRTQGPPFECSLLFVLVGSLRCRRIQ
jgi:hypothetical protein